MSISAGVAGASIHTPGAGALLKKADQALYQTKLLGRNRVCLAHAELHEHMAVTQ